MTSELEKAAVIWAKDLNANTVQFCDSRGSRSEEAFIQKCKLSFEMGAMLERKRILAEAEMLSDDCMSDSDIRLKFCFYPNYAKSAG